MNPQRSISTLQESIWLTQHIYPSSPLFNVGGYALVNGAVQLPLLTKAITTVLEQADVIETGYAVFNDTPLKDNPRFAAFDIDIIDLSQHEDAADACLRWMKQDMQAAFDPGRSLLKVRLLKAGDSTCYWYAKVHHALFDGYAMALFFNKVARLYAAIEKGEDSSTVPLFEYGGFIRDELQYKASRQYQDDRQWWAQRLAGTGKSNAFQSCAQPGSKHTMRTRRLEQRIDSSLFSEITAFCKSCSCTAFHYFIAVLLMLHKRYNNEEELLLGIPVFNRNRKQFKETLGAFVNILPFSVPVAGEATFSQVLSLVSRELRECYRHQRFPLYDILKERDQQGNIYNVSFSYQKNSYDASLGNAQASIHYLPAPEQQEDLFFHLLEYGDGADLTLAVDYAADLFPEHIMQHLLRHYEHLLRVALRRPDAPVNVLPYLTAAEEQQLLDTFNPNAGRYETAATIISQFERQVQEAPDRTALVFDGRSLSYEALNACANQLARYLQEHYLVQADELIGLQLARSEWQVIAILGVLKAGGAYVPIDPAYPAERIAYLIGDSRCKAVIDAPVLEAFRQCQDAYSTADLPLQAGPSDLAYVIYTSGSTGHPKGVMIEHRQVLSFFSNFHAGYLLEPGMVWGSGTSYTFDISVLELLGSLTGGVKLVLLSSPDPQGMLEEMKATGVTILQVTPSRLSQLLESSEAGVSALSSLKWLLVGGEALGQQHYERLQELTGTRVLNMYGPTEATIWSSSLELHGSTTLTIGRPLQHEYLYITDDRLQLCPVGITGEICIGGAGLARGYLHRAELTAEKFVANPYRAGERLYRTGDLGRWQPDGTIVFMGRRDDQVKVRGHRIELGEIAHAMQQYPGISAAIVVMQGANPEDKELVSYYTGSPGLDAAAIKAYLDKRLPAYMLPACYIQLDAFPLNASGKVDRKRLPAPQGHAFVAGREYVAPRNQTEEQLMGIWEAVLGRTGIGVKDHFFELGGHSLKATRLLSQVYKAFEVKIALHDLFGTPVLEDQAALIDRSRKTAYSSILPAPEQASYPLSSSQRRLWVLSQFQESNVAYNMPGAYVFEGELDIPSLTYAFNELIRRHEILRTVFNEDENGEVRQYILPVNTSTFTIDYIDLRGMVNQQARLQALAERTATRAFDLARGPLLRAGLYHISDQRWVFAYTMHHIISDGWSMDVLLRELLHIYNARTVNQPHALPGLRIQYKDYACWQQARLKDGALSAAREHWLQQFEGELPQLPLPLDHARPAVRTYNGGVVVKPLPAGLSGALKLFVKEQGATLFMGLLGLVNVLLHRYTQQEDIIIGTPIAGRGHADLSDQIGVYINTLALRTRFKGGNSFLQLLAQVRENMLAAYEHQAYPFDELVDQLQLQRDMSRNALFDVMVILQNNERHQLSGAGILNNLHISQYESHTREISKLDVTFEFEETGEELAVNIQYNSDLFEAASIHRMATHLEQLLAAVLRTPDAPVNALSYLTAAEEQQLLDTFNPNTGRYETAATIISQFERQVQEAPDRTALVFDGRSLSYEALNACANQLARYLQEHYQVQADELIGLQLARSEWQVIAILGVLKAGGAYVPIDPAYPAERIAYLIGDSRCKAVIDAPALEAFRQCQDAYSTADLPLQAGPSDLAYVIYTSGSTGHPKGVMIEHRQVLSFFSNFHAGYLLEPGMVWGSGTSYTFDISVLELLGSLTGGVKLVLLSSPDPQGMLEEMKATGVTILQVTPSRLSQLLESSEAGVSALSSLKWLLVGGEALGQQYYERLQELTGTCVLNMYGPTEATIWSSSLELHGSTTLTIGRPLQHEYLYITDDRLQLCPVGITGEICIGGAGLARGYLHRAELTAEKFVANPYRAGERLYRTGDLGRWLPDGTIVFMGRRDDQVKIRGYRIELGEIERALQSHAAIEAAVVLAKAGAGREPELVAYVVSAQSLHAVELRAHLQRQLPAYMLPEHYVQLSTFPLNASGKVDRKRLPAPQGLGLSAGKAYIAPRNETEEKLVAIWEAILGRTGIGVKDHFFELGGHSLKATRLASRLFKDFGVRIALKDLFSNAVLEGQAALIDTTHKDGYTAIASLAAQPSYALSSSQRRLWVLSQFEESSAAYNMPGVYTIRGRLQPALLTAAFNAVIARHEILRTVFSNDGEGEVRQFALPASGNFKILFKDVRGQEAGLPALIERFCSAPFGLATGPLLRVAVYEVSDEEWVLAFVMHHIISDGWSLGVLIRELLQAYGGDATAGMPPLPVQYKDYAAWQQAQLSGPALAAHKAYWLSQFAGPLPVLELAGDKPRPAVKTYKGGLVRRQLNAAVSSQLAAQAQAAGCTLFMGLLAAVNALLYRYTRQEDIIVGSPVAGREHSDLEDQIGFYVNTLALRSRFSGSNSFLELLGILREVTLQAYAHQAYPFDELVDDLQLQRDMSRNPLFDVLVLLQDNELTPALSHTEVRGMLLQPYEGKRPAISKFDLSFIFEPTTAGIDLSIEYSSDIYNASTVERLAGHFEQLLSSMLGAPATAIKQLSFLTREEEQRLLASFNNTRVDYPADKTLATLFAEQAAATPAHTALVFESTAYTYQELDELSNRFANFLQEHCQIMPGDLVGIRLERSEWLIVTILGILKAGGAYVPFDPLYPEERIAFMLADTSCKTVIAAGELEQFRATAGCYSTFSPVCMQAPDSLAYIMYTSGSTGTPKGVMVSHRNVVRLVKSPGYTDLGSQQVLLSTGAVSFDATTFEYWGMLLNGGQLVLCSQDALLDEQQMAQLISRHKVSMMWFTAGWLHQLIDKDITIFAGLKTVIAGGDKLSALHINRLRRHYPAMQVINGYGPTENTTFSLTYPIRTAQADIPLGYPINNSTAYILDETLQLCPIGVVGEIVVGGDGLARGYLHRDELTAEKFINNPYAPGERLYRTGDLGRWLPDGAIAFMGRRDDQVKIRGYRIEPGEIEHVMQSHAGISAAVVTVHSAATGDKELVSYFTGEPGLDAAAIRAYMGKQLPSYMLPDYYVQLEAFPLTPNGKVDRKRLPAPQGLGLASGREYVAPRNATEEKLVAIWEEILGRTGISVKDDFFELGGHSLRATRLASQLYKEFEVKVPLKDLFGTPVLEDQAALLAGTHKTAYSGIMPASQQDSYVLSSSQRRLWLLSQLEEGSVAYNIPGVYVFTGELKLPSLNHAFHVLIRRHEILRTVFRENGKGEVRQFIQPADQDIFNIHYTDLRGMDDQQQQVEGLVIAGARQPFNLENGPLLRVSLYQTEEKRWVFAYTMHHIISDGWSMDILIRELLLVYNSHVQALAQELAPLGIQYKDYACWQQAQLEDGMLAADQVYWLLQFEGTLPILSLPTDYPRPAIRSYNSGAVYRQLPADTVQALHTLCQQQGVTLFMSLLGLVNVLLHRYTWQEDIIIGTPVAGRNQADLLDQIGFYVNTLALRTKFNGSDTYAELLERVREITLAAYEHQAYPLDELVEELQLERDISRNALFDVMITLQQRDQSVLKQEQGLRGLQVQPFESSSLEVSKFDITYEFIESGASLAVNIKYNRDLFNAATIERMAGHLEQLLQAVTSRPHSAVNKLPYLSEAEETTLLTTFGSSSNSYDHTANIVSLFEAQVRKTPADTAVVYEGRALSYKELNAGANRLAHYLQQYHRPGTDSLVGMMIDRSLEMLTGMLGILKSGAAYVPVDPEFPEARIAYLLQDSGVEVLLTQSRYLPLTAGFKGRVVCLDDSSYAEGMPADNPVNSFQPSCLAYVIYTSGSTGQPKGVMISHAALVDYTYGLLARTNIGECRSFGLVSTIAADLGNTVIYTSLLTGGSLHIYSTDAVMNGEELFAAPVDCIKIVPSHWKALQQAGSRLFAPHKCLIFGGEQLTGDVLALLHNRGAACQVYNHYGPSETTIGKLVNPVSFTGANGAIPLGAPFCNSFVCIVDPLLQLTGIGVTGEICIGGDGLSRGYLHREALTAEKFVPNPYRPGERMYRTGDLGRWLPDGTVVFMGRTDDQVKIRGYRIELGEIAGIMQEHAAVDAAVVVVRDNARGEKELLGYFTGRAAPDAATLRTYLAQRLPAYSVPAYLVQLDALPLTANGKVNRKQLPVPEGLDLSGGRQYIAPGTPAEVLLAGIWEAVLNRSGIGIDDNFFELGGHSLLAVKLVNRVNRETGAAIKVKDVFTHTSIREMAQLISATQPAAPLLIPPAPAAADYVLSTHQRRLWLTCQQPGNTIAYNIPGALLLEGALNLANLQTAYQLLTARHESLRTVFINEEVLPRQQVTAAGSADFEIQEMDHMPDAAQLNQLVKQESGRPFVLYGQPLVRVRVIAFPGNRFLLLVVMHHIISDGWSMEIFIREWISLYAGLEQGQEPLLPPLPIQYKDYAVWQQEYMQGAAYENVIRYWRQRLSGELPVLHLPFARPHTADTGMGGEVFHFTVDDQLYASLQELAVAQQSTLYSLLFTAFNVLLYHISHQQDIILGTSVAGRRHESLESIIGFFVNTLAIKTSIAPGEDFTRLLQRTGEQLLNDFEHQDMPFEELVTHLDYERIPGVNPVFQARFVLNSAREDDFSGLEELGISVSAIGLREVSSKFDLSLVMRPGRHLTGIIEYRSQLFKAESMSLLSAGYVQLLEAVVKQPHQPVGQLDTFNAAYQQHLDSAKKAARDSLLKKLQTIQKK